MNNKMWERRGTLHSANKIQTTNSVNFLKYYVDASFILCLCPFRTVRTSPVRDMHDLKGTLSYLTWLPQKIICILFTILGGISVLGELRMSLPSGNKTPYLHFHLVAEVFDSLLKVATVYQFWMRKQDILKIIEILEVKEKGVNPENFFNRPWPPKTLIGAVISVYTTAAVINWIIGPGVQVYVSIVDEPTSNSWCISRWWLEMVKWGHHNFFLKSKLSQNISCYTKENLTHSQIIVGALSTLGYLHRRLLGSYTDLLILGIAISVRRANATFTKLLDFNNFSTTEWPDCLNRFQSLQQLTKQVNNLLGTNISLIVAYTVAFLAISLDAVFVNQEESHNFGKIFKVVFSYSNYTLILLLSADATQQVHLVA